MGRTNAHLNIWASLLKQLSPLRCNVNIEIDSVQFSIDFSSRLLSLEYIIILFKVLKRCTTVTAKSVLKSFFTGIERKVLEQTQGAACV